MLASKVESMLAQVYGFENVAVQISADLSFDQREQQVTTYDTGNETPVRTRTSRRPSPVPVTHPAEPRGRRIHQRGHRGRAQRVLPQ